MPLDIILKNEVIFYYESLKTSNEFYKIFKMLKEFCEDRKYKVCDKSIRNLIKHWEITSKKCFFFLLYFNFIFFLIYLGSLAKKQSLTRNIFHSKITCYNMYLIERLLRKNRELTAKLIKIG